MSADVVGYSAMMAHDDVGTVATLLRHMRRIHRLVLLHAGRVVDATGDNLLAEFANETDAFSCAQAIQRAIADCNRDLPDTQRMRFRIGLHSGDLLHLGGRIYGDVVNVAARLQAAAEPETIWLSEAAAERVASGSFDAVGARWFKNIPRPIAAVRHLPRG